jgi:hypothetical protein
MNRLRKIVLRLLAIRDLSVSLFSITIPLNYIPVRVQRPLRFPTLPMYNIPSLRVSVSICRALDSASALVFRQRQSIGCLTVS